MRQATDVFSEQFPQMRERCLSLAADMDRVGRASGGMESITNDPRYQDLRRAIEILLDSAPERARRVLEVFSDPTTTVK